MSRAGDDTIFNLRVSTSRERTEGVIGVADEIIEEAGRGIQPPQNTQRDRPKQRHLFQPPPFLSRRAAGCRNGESNSPGYAVSRCFGGGVRERLANELFGQRFDRLTAINEMRFGPMCIDRPERIGQAIDRPA